MSLLADLNKEQKKAITHENGPLLIVAGAGTGKTTVITRKIAHLIVDKKVPPENILALTFTEKAAEEMEERIEALLPFGYFDLWVSTFHSFAEKILKEHALDIGLPNNFKLLSESEQWLLIRHNLDEFNLDYYQPKGNPTRFIEALVKHFSRLKDEDITPQDYLAYAKKIKLDKDANEQEIESETKRINELASAYHTYQKILLRNNSMDFGDLITYTIKIFKERPRVLKKYSEQFKYILVDEFQDTNYAQYDLIKMLSKKHNNLTVVGDDDQSIYKFRGASVSNILAFKKDYPKCQEVVLVDNFRSGQNILDLAHNFIKLNNPDRLEAKLKIKKSLISHSKKDSELKHLHFTAQEEEASGVIKKILEIKKPDNSWNDFAILIRANNQANLFIPYLERADIPYQFLASAGLFSKPLVLDLLAYMRLLDNYHESRAMYRVLNIPVFNIGPEEIFSLLNYAKKKTVSLFEAMRENPSAKNNVILALAEKHTNMAKTKSTGEVLLKFLEESGYLKYLTKNDDQKARENSLYLNQFYKYISKFEEAVTDKSVRNFIEQMNMLHEAGEQGSLKPDFQEGPETLKVLTIHSAKGLEFKYVFIVNMVDKRFPSIERPDAIPLPEALIKEALPEGDAHLQEERRLFYVAITRAKDGLYLTSAEDYGGARKKKLSRFLIEAGLAKEKKAKPTGQVKFEPVKKSTSKEKSGKNIIDWTNHKFSFTQLTAFETCPWQYRFAHLLKIPVPGKSSFSFGKTIHSTLYEFFRRMREKNESVQADLFGKKKNEKPKESIAPSLKELLEIYEEHWIDEWYFSKKNKDEYYKKGKEILKNFYELHKNSWPKTEFLEQPFILKINDYSIKGAIDRIDAVEQSLEIIDYKTGQFPKTKKEPKQLILYALAVKETLKQEAKKITYYYIEENKQTSYEIKKDDYEKVKDWIIKIINDILKGDFKAKPGHNCQYCDYSSICEYRK
ncbi:MAG: UvrD-helicase domain-containing protein [Patescibacteria group bacterium]|jgi:DNA helicase-2/ATP-dependent DNA helicase PcrA